MLSGLSVEDHGLDEDDEDESDEAGAIEPADVRCADFEVR